jgi:hypothetical protein
MGRSSRADWIVRILDRNARGTIGSAAFSALLECEGKPYQAFRDLGGSKGSKNRTFSPSQTMRKAERLGIVRLDAPLSGSPQYLGAAKPSSQPKSRHRLFQPFADVVHLRLPEATAVVLALETDIPFNQKYGLLAEVAKFRQIEGTTIWEPGIYAWDIEGVGVYVGKFTRANRPLGEYDKNTSRLLRGIAYRPAKPDGFRRVHRALAGAVQQGRSVQLSIVENCQKHVLDERERIWISQVSSGGLNS